jgi:Protein of unknown function (DUF1488)
MNDVPFFHDASGSVRFWVQVGDRLMSASVSREALHYRYRPDGTGEDPMETFRFHSAEIESAVRRRFAEGALEPVMLREHDLRVQLQLGQGPS